MLYKEKRSPLRDVVRERGGVKCTYSGEGFGLVLRDGNICIIGRGSLPSTAFFFLFFLPIFIIVVFIIL